MARAAYYNENDAFVAAWLRELIARNLIAPGEVDERSIEDVCADDLKGFTQCHFFAGLAGWSYALRLAGWPDDEPVWTGSCPCQPLSSAGQRKGHADARHLWPAFYRLIAECLPATVFGEQVASALGREWFAAVRVDLEGLGYALGAADLPAASVGAPHIRQRLFWVADAHGARSTPWREAAQAARHRRSVDAGDRSRRRMGDTDSEGLPVRECEALSRARRRGQGPAAQQPSGSFWAKVEWLACTDGKARPTQPGLLPLAHGLPRSLAKLRGRRRRLVALAGLDARGLARARSHRVGVIRGAGNAINPQAGAKFIAAYRDMLFERQAREAAE